MPTTSFTATVQGCDQYAIALHMAPSTNDFDLSLIAIDYTPGITGFDGCWSSGSPLHGGSRMVQVDPTDYARLEAECVPNTAVTVTITYHDNSAGQHCIDSIDCAPVLTHALNALAKISLQLDPIPELRQISVAQLQAQERILALLEQVRPAPWNGDERRRRSNGGEANAPAERTS